MTCTAVHRTVEQAGLLLSIGSALQRLGAKRGRLKKELGSGWSGYLVNELQLHAALLPMSKALMFRGQGSSAPPAAACMMTAGTASAAPWRWV